MSNYINNIVKSIELGCFYGTRMQMLTEYNDGGYPEVDYKTLDEAISEEKDGVFIKLENNGVLNFFPIYQKGINTYYRNIVLSFGTHKIIFNSIRMGIVDADYQPTIFSIENNKIIEKTEMEIEKIIFSNFIEFSNRYISSDN